MNINWQKNASPCSENVVDSCNESVENFLLMCVAQLFIPVFDHACKSVIVLRKLEPRMIFT